MSTEPTPSEQNGDTDPTTGSAGHDDRIVRAVEEYLAAVESGRRPNRRQFVARHPEIATELSACLQGLALVNSAAARIAADAGVESDHHVGPSAQPLGDFRLLREIGRGGMGIVYEALQLSLGRRVAVKVLPLASALDPRRLQRFRNEAQAAAQLHHTNIVPVYAVGAERSVHFYAMQLIEGQSLSEVIRQIRAASGRKSRETPGTGDTAPTVPMERAATGPLPGAESGSSITVTPPAAPRQPASARGAAQDREARRSVPRGDLSQLATSPAGRRRPFYREVARLGLQAAEALDYAHQQGVVHRDIKPANLLLDVSGKLWISDFGLAQIYADGGLTQTGDVLGTYRYMSPEQASGKAVVLDQRTDVYSLGMTLYELLTLEQGLPGWTRQELLRQIESLDPRPPRQIDPGIPPELETILLKAVAKDPADRYFSAGALAEDLRRFLADEPILAKPPSSWNRAIKWVRRHRAIAIAAIVSLVFITIASLVATTFIAYARSKTEAAYHGEQAQRVQADEQRDKARQEQGRAERSYREARRAVDYFAKVAAEQMPKDPSLVDIKQGMLETALDYYRGFLEERRGDSAEASDLAIAEAQVESILEEVSAAGNLVRLDLTIMLLRQPAVQTELHLSEKQIAQIDALPHHSGPPPVQSRQSSSARMAQTAPAQTRPKSLNPMAQEGAQREAALEKLLSRQQLERLRQLSRQLRGVFAFSDPDVASALALTPSQKQAVRAAQAGCYNLVRHGPHGPGHDGGPGNHPPDDHGPGDDGPNGEALKSQMAAAVDRVLTQLTQKQADTWRGLTGAPFHFEEVFPFGPDHGPHGPPPRD